MRYQNMMNEMIICDYPKQAACLFLYNRDYNVLVVTRKNTDILSLPGGKVDPGETTLEAVVRETTEETGIRLRHDALIPVYTNLVEGDVDYLTTVYFSRFEDWIVRPASWSVEEGINCSFVPVQQLLEQGTFKEFNTKAFRVISKLI